MVIDFHSANCNSYSNLDYEVFFLTEFISADDFYGANFNLDYGVFCMTAFISAIIKVQSIILKFAQHPD